MAEKQFRAVPAGVSVWSSPGAPVEHGRANMKAENFTAILREDTPAYPVYIRRRRKTLEDMTVEELFQMAKHFRRSKRSQDEIEQSGAYSLKDEICRIPDIDALPAVTTLPPSEFDNCKW
ncbi:hypothetical protein BV898_10593 [Hypsibius exemplaris]|uniref:Uncharacterized protein n=1 Tax=Hypsibius exemplaris TaxID=2072580 RepID=A0A1W0WJ60_HYPEX|nr:hypothetical protein BV898_10593 [Hypsibius exemplaris]